MSYVFISPQYRVRECPTDGAMGFIGPDQPWTEETAGQPITPVSKPCSEDWIKVKGGSQVPNHLYNPKSKQWELIVDKNDCFDTGEVIEARQPGRTRVKMYCCPPNEWLPRKEFTEAEQQQHGANCQPFYYQGHEFPAKPVWIDARLSTPTGWSTKDPPVPVTSGGYRMMCQAIRGDVQFEFDPTMVMGGARSSIEQAEKMIAERAARIAERTAIVEAAEEEFEYGFFQRYGVYMLGGAGIIGLGVIAGLVKRSMDKKKEKKS